MTGSSGVLPLVMENVTLGRGGKNVLKSIDCTFEPNPAKTLIIGPNGAGKSLFLRVAHGLVPPDEGRVFWPRCDDIENVRKSQAMVFQRPVMLRRSARDNIEFALKVHNVPRAERRERALRFLKRTGLIRYADKPARTLSFGEQQRLAIARALAVEPKVLFLDEPTASLDPAATHLVEELIIDAAGAGVKIVMSSHDLNQTRRLADEVIFLHRGRIKERAEAKKFFAEPKNDLAAAFIKGELLWWRRQSIYENGVHRDANNS